MSTLTSSSRELIQQIANKLSALGKATLQAYEAGELSGSSLAPLCQEIITLEEQLHRQTITTLPAMPAPASSGTHQIPVCEHCGAVLVPGKKFCTQCGAPIKKTVTPFTPTLPAASTPLVCGRCAKPLPANARFCTHCGESVPS
jgi:predicted amidophosphoribosyltransferase